jgi:hypothetical protein
METKEIKFTLKAQHSNLQQLSDVPDIMMQITLKA